MYLGNSADDLNKINSIKEEQIEVNMAVHPG